MSLTVARPSWSAARPHRGPYVYDSVARDLKQFVREGRVEIVDEETLDASGERLIDRIAFRRLR